MRFVLTLINLHLRIINIAGIRYCPTCYYHSSKKMAMKSLQSQTSGLLNKLFFSILRRLFQQPDFYPIKYYHKRKKHKHVLDSL